MTEPRPCTPAEVAGLLGAAAPRRGGASTIATVSAVVRTRGHGRSGMVGPVPDRAGTRLEDAGLMTTPGVLCTRAGARTVRA
jgi:hypothetical protein